MLCVLLRLHLHARSLHAVLQDSQCQAFFKHAGETMVLLENRIWQSWFSEFGPSLLPSTRTNNLDRTAHIVLICFKPVLLHPSLLSTGSLHL